MPGLGQLPAPALGGDLLRSRRILERERCLLLTSGRVFSLASPADRDGLELIGEPCQIFIGPHRLSAVQFYATPTGSSSSNGMAAGTVTGASTGISVGAGLGDTNAAGTGVVRRSSISILQKFLLSAGATSHAVETGEPVPSTTAGEGNENGGSSNGPSSLSPTDKLIKELLSKNPTLGVLMSSTAATTTGGSVNANPGFTHSSRRHSITRMRSLYFSIKDRNDLWAFPTTAVVEPRADDVVVKLGIPLSHEDHTRLTTSEYCHWMTMIIVGASPALVSLLQLITTDPLLVSSFTDFIPRLHPASLPNVPFEELASPPFIPPRILATDLLGVLPPSTMKRSTGSNVGAIALATTATAVATKSSDSKDRSKNRTTTAAAAATKLTRGEMIATSMTVDSSPRMDAVKITTMTRSNTNIIDTITGNFMVASGTETNVGTTTAAGASRPTTIIPIIAPIKKRKYMTASATTATMATTVSPPTKEGSMSLDPKTPP